MPLSAGIFEKNDRKASRPPADAPMPTIRWRPRPGSPWIGSLWIGSLPDLAVLSDGDPAVAWPRNVDLDLAMLISRSIWRSTQWRCGLARDRTSAWAGQMTVIASPPAKPLRYSHIATHARGTIARAPPLCGLRPARTWFGHAVRLEVLLTRRGRGTAPPGPARGRPEDRLRGVEGVRRRTGPSCKPPPPCVPHGPPPPPGEEKRRARNVPELLPCVG